jgi:hypothetical protein
VNPGDIYLNRGVKLTYVHDLVKQTGQTIGGMGVTLWMIR